MFKGDETTTNSNTLSFDTNKVLTFTPSGMGRFIKYVELNNDWECEFKYKVNNGNDGVRLGIQSINKNGWERGIISCKNVPEGMYVGIAQYENTQSISETKISERFTDWNTIKITCINNEVTIYVNELIKKTGTIDWAKNGLTLGYERWANQSISLKYFKIKAL